MLAHEELSTTNEWDYPGNAKILNANVGDAMPQTNNMTNYQFTIALMVFIVAYCIFEAPSNLALKILTPNRQVKLEVQGKICRL